MTPNASLALLKVMCVRVQLWVPVFGQIVTALFVFQLFMVGRLSETCTSRTGSP